MQGREFLSDEWGACGIYTHDNVNHRQNFVDPHDDTVHTQGIEGM